MNNPMQQIMQQAQAMQQKMQDAQAELDTLEVEGVSGGGMVKARLTGKYMVKGITIDESLMVADEKDVLEDLIVAALNDGHKKAESASAEKMSGVTSGIPLPPGMKLPF